MRRGSEPMSNVGLTNKYVQNYCISQPCPLQELLGFMCIAYSREGYPDTTHSILHVFIHSRSRTQTCSSHSFAEDFHERLDVHLEPIMCHLLQ